MTTMRSHVGVNRMGLSADARHLSIRPACSAPEPHHARSEYERTWVTSRLRPVESDGTYAHAPPPGPDA
jgi:hypothetical protein